MISAFRAVFGVLFHSIHHFKNYSTRHSERSGATHVDTLGLPSTRHPEALAEGATQRICTRVSEAKLVPKTTLLRAVQIQDRTGFCIAFHGCKILNQVQDDSVVGTFDNNRRAAFTLAEVLITLGIIGIVAAMTIPTLISNMQEMYFHAKWKECYATLNNAFKMAAAHEPALLVKAKNSYYIKKEFISAILSNLQVIDECSAQRIYGNDLCDYNPENSNVKYKWAGILHDNIDACYYKSLAGNVICPGDFGVMAALLKNGAAVYFGGLWQEYTIVVDVNNFTGGPNILGKDVYAISLSSGNPSQIHPKNLYIEDLHFKPYGAVGTLTEINGYSGCDPNIGTDAERTLYEAPGAGCSYKYLYEK